MRRLWNAAPAAAVIFVLAACGSTSSKPTPTVATTTSTSTSTQATTSTTSTASASALTCPVGSSQMGCSVQRTYGLTLGSTITGERIPDVSSYQGTVNWPQTLAAESGSLKGGIFKLGEISADPYALANAKGIKTAGGIAVGYWFVRPGVAALTIIAEARATGVHLIVLDEEVPGIQGTAARLTPALKADGFAVADYHSAGNVFDTSADGLDCWVAAYGPSTPPTCTTGERIAWQFTDSGSVPGISGHVDLSVSYKLLHLGHRAKPAVKPKPKPKPARVICWGKGATPTSKACKPIRAHYSWLIKRYRHDQGVVRYALHHRGHPGLKHFEHFVRVRGIQAAKLRGRYTA